MLAAIALVRQILALAPEAVALVKGIVGLVRGHDIHTQRVALDAAFTATEDAIARRWGK